jgi:parvulin-like peptidyl-prolyl isomerase
MTPLAAMVAGLLGLWPFNAEVPDAKVVARVQTAQGEVQITAARLRAYAAGHEDQEPRRLLQDLVDFELLAAEAQARGLADDPMVREETRPVLVRRYLRRDFEAHTTGADIPRDLLMQAYDQNRFFFQREVGRSGDHIIVTTSVGKRPADPALDEKAHALSLRIRDDLAAKPPKDAEAFLAAAARYEADAAAAGLIVRGEALGAFPREGMYDPKFTEKAFELDQPGSLTQSFPTQFGWHVFRLKEPLPARNVSFELAEAELRERTLPDYRLKVLRDLTDRLAREIEVIVNFAPIQDLQSRRKMEEGEGLAPH